MRLYQYFAYAKPRTDASARLRWTTLLSYSTILTAVAGPARRQAAAITAEALESELAEAEGAEAPAAAAESTDEA